MARRNIGQWCWEKAAYLSLTSTVSANFNNLSAGGKYAVYGQVEDAIVVDLSVGGPCTSIPFTSKPTRVFQVAVICEEANGDVIIAVLSSNGLELWRQAPNRPPMLGSLIALRDLTSPTTYGDAVELQGVAVVSGGFICVGNSSGTIIVCGGRSGSGNSPTGTGGAGGGSALTSLPMNARPQRFLAAHAAPVSCLCGVGSIEGGARGADASMSLRELLASSDDDGTVRVFRVAGGTFDPLATIPGPGGGVPCTTMAGVEDLLVAGFASGNIRVLSVSTNSGSIALVADIAAHSRAVASLDLHPGSVPLLATAGEDTFVHVFSLNAVSARSAKPGGGDAQLLFTSRCEDKLLRGVQFARDGTERLLAVAYDRDELLVWNRAQ